MSMVFNYSEVLGEARSVRTQPRRGLYFLLLDGDIVFIAQSNDCDARIRKELDWAKEFDAYTVFELGDIGLDVIERENIEHFQPRYNLIPTGSI